MNKFKEKCSFDTSLGMEPKKVQDVLKELSIVI